MSSSYLFHLHFSFFSPTKILKFPKPFYPSKQKYDVLKKNSSLMVVVKYLIISGLQSPKKLILQEGVWGY